MRHRLRCSTVLGALAFAALGSTAIASEPPAPQVSPAPVPSAQPHARVRIGVASDASYVNQQFAGPGIAPPEAAAFASGQPIAPGTPYDLWTSSPNVTGYGVNHSLLVTPAYSISRALDVEATIGFGSISGTRNVAAYWGNQTFPTLNPHLGRAPSAIAFPVANGTDQVAATGSSLVVAGVKRTDGTFSARAGWFDLVQTEPFVVNQPAQTNTPLLFTEPLAEGLGDGADTLRSLESSRTRLPLYGMDLVAQPRAGTRVELSDAELPEPAGTHARLLSASLAFEGRNGVTGGVQIAHVATGGERVGTTVLFGANPSVTASDQGPLPTSTLASQRMTIAGIRAGAPVARNVDALARFGISWYAADGIASPQAPGAAGGYEDLRLRRSRGDFELGLEAMHMDATYAPAILPYGAGENVWSAAYSWPGTWLKGDYQLVEDAQMGPNRAGVRATARFTVRGLETRLAYATFRQLRPYDAGTAYQSGFVEGFYLPQLFAPGTLGIEHHAAATLIAHPAPVDVELDLTDISLARRGSAGHPEEAVAVENPGATLTLSRRFGQRAVASVGAGRNAMLGAFDAAGAPNVDIAERVVFGALQWNAGPHVAYAVQYRLYSVDGAPTRMPGGAPVSAAYHGPQLMLEQRIRI